MPSAHSQDQDLTAGVLVAILRAHLKEFGTAKKERIFGNERGGVVGSSTYWRVWEEAREYALPPERVEPLHAVVRTTCGTSALHVG
ncbi:hypothetical protein ACFVIL_36365 [Streptomyces sp. NPDC127159]|uniref:hypothetical protein n=1 Tax=unclassified Streptomyces TaxID=2593676 RepID=UPI0036295ED9